MTLTIPYYESPNMLKKQLEYWTKYPPGVLARLNIIIIDDGSPNYPAFDVLKGCDLNVQLYRIKENKPWNYVGARNLGFVAAEEGWVFQTDMDHVITKESMQVLLMKEASLNPERFYKPVRYHVNAPREDYKSHNSSFIILRKKFWEVGGYNEDFAGWYGGGSSAFRKELHRRLNYEILDNVYLLHYQDVIEDASVKDWGRKNSPYYYKNDPEMRRKANALMKNYESPNPLRFEWEKINLEDD